MKLLLILGKESPTFCISHVYISISALGFINSVISGLIRVKNPLGVIGDFKQSRIGSPYSFAIYNKRSSRMSTKWKPKVYQLNGFDHHYWTEIKRLIFDQNNVEVEY